MNESKTKLRAYSALIQAAAYEDDDEVRAWMVSMISGIYALDLRLRIDRPDQENS